MLDRQPHDAPHADAANEIAAAVVKTEQAGHAQAHSNSQMLMAVIRPAAISSRSSPSSDRVTLRTRFMYVHIAPFRFRFSVPPGGAMLQAWTQA